MPTMMENVSTLNSFLRTLLMMVVLGALTVGGWFGYNTYNAADLERRKQAQALADAETQLKTLGQDLASARQEIAVKAEELIQKEARISELGEDIERLEASLHLLKVDHRLARITVTEQTKDETTGKLATRIEFVELNDEGHPLDKPREFSIIGDLIYVDSWVVKFDDQYIEQADLERGASLILFKRIFGAGQKPEEGFPLDEAGSQPGAYARGGKMTDLEKKIWGDFWSIANDEAQASKLGIRAAHGEAVSMKVQKGKSYKIQLRASDGLAITPEEKAP